MTESPTETSPIAKTSLGSNLLWFTGGLLLMFLVFWFVLRPKAEGVQDIQSKVAAEQKQTITKQEQTISDLQSQLQSVTDQKNACDARFQRATILYDEGLLGSTRAWILPVDVEPVAAPNKRGTFSHYDPKTQTETVKFQPKSQ